YVKTAVRQFSDPVAARCPPANGVGRIRQPDLEISVMTQNKDQTDASADESTTPAPTIRSGGSDSGKKPASIGPSITIHGDVTGEEDLVVAGTIEGTVNLKENNLVVDENGHIMANITARIIRVDGEVKGELRASEKVVIKPTGN